MWILENRSIPRTGLFSQYTNLAWTDSSWLLDVLVAAMYKLFGLKALPMLLMVLKAALAGVTFVLARAMRASFWSAVALSALAQYAILSLQPLPYVFSILFFAVELWVLVRSRRSGSTRELFWLPLLFAVWANVHLQFVVGLLVLGFFLIALLLEDALRRAGVMWLSRRIVPVPIAQVGVITALCVIATLLNPYTFHPLAIAYKTLYSSVGFEHFAEMSALSFRKPQEYVLMLLIMAAFLALGRLRSLELFELITLLAGTAVAFRIQRDAWMAVLPAVAVLSGGLGLRELDQESRPSEDRPSKDRPSSVVTSSQRAYAGALALVVLFIAVWRIPDDKELMSKVSENFPVRACEYMADNHLGGPIFNSYLWGSFLTWYAPQYPVVADSRVELYGNDVLSRYFDVVGGKERLESEPTVARAGMLLIEKQSAIARALVKFPALSAQYKLVYSDDIASVYVPQRAAQ